MSSSATDSPPLPPLHTQVLIIGGGPAGSYAAAVLARENIDVTLFEASKFPRYHVGESLIPSVRHFLRFIDAEDKIADHGFVCKPGSAIKFNQFKREGYTDFVALGADNNAWNVVRSEFDDVLLNHARSMGASVYEQTKVESIGFSTDNPDQPISVSWSHTPSPPSPPPQLPKNPNVPLIPGNGKHGNTSFSYLIDATGRSGILSTRYLKNRYFNSSLKNIAVWGYWRNATQYKEGTSRGGAPWFEALTDESGWAWHIPLHNGTTSIGVVVSEKVYYSKVASESPLQRCAATSTTTARYLYYLSLAPGVVDLITGHGSLEPGSIKSASDYSYSAPSYAGNGYRIIGDAGAFIDPFFSSGVHLAMTSALSAAATICASIRQSCSEGFAANWHSLRVSTSYTRFQVVVLSAYKQIQSQSGNILSDIDEDNYDRAFALLRPVIQGASDMGAQLSEQELQKSLDFCVKLFNPTTPEQHDRLSQSNRIPPSLFDASTPVVDVSTFEKILGQNPHDTEMDGEATHEARLILNKINARRIVQPEYSLHNFELEALEGYVLCLERGKLGLVPSCQQSLDFRDIS